MKIFGWEGSRTRGRNEVIPWVNSGIGSQIAQEHYLMMPSSILHSLCWSSNPTDKSQDTPVSKTNGLGWELLPPSIKAISYQKDENVQGAIWVGGDAGSTHAGPKTSERYTVMNTFLRWHWTQQWEWGKYTAIPDRRGSEHVDASTEKSALPIQKTPLLLIQDTAHTLLCLPVGGSPGQVSYRTYEAFQNFLYHCHFKSKIADVCSVS